MQSLARPVMEGRQCHMQSHEHTCLFETTDQPHVAIYSEPNSILQHYLLRVVFRQLPECDCNY